MSKYLATILGLGALTSQSAAAAVFPAQPFRLGQESPAPVAAPSAQDSPPAAAPVSPPTEPPQAGVETQSGAQPASGEKKPESAPPATKAHTTTRKRHQPKSRTSTPNTSPDKKVIRNGGTADPVVQLTPGMSKEQASSQRQSTTQLLSATDNNLKQISGRQLNPSQQDSVSQIRKYMEQAKAAEQAGDVERAHNLASKALLLSDDLAKH
jgi:hypothetical protein